MQCMGHCDAEEFAVHTKAAERRSEGNFNPQEPSERCAGHYNAQGFAMEAKAADLRSEGDFNLQGLPKRCMGHCNAQELAVQARKTVCSFLCPFLHDLLLHLTLQRFYQMKTYW